MCENGIFAIVRLYAFNRWSCDARRRTVLDFNLDFNIFKHVKAYPTCTSNLTLPSRVLMYCCKVGV